jgi:hypothetical protein
MFINGEYAGKWPSAGMLGYVQCDTCAAWFSRLASGLAERRLALSVCDSPDWIPAGWKDAGLGDVHISSHERPLHNLSRMQIFHLLLEFT